MNWHTINWYSPSFDDGCPGICRRSIRRDLNRDSLPVSSHLLFEDSKIWRACQMKVWLRPSHFVVRSWVRYGDHWLVNGKMIAVSGATRMSFQREGRWCGLVVRRSISVNPERTA